MCAFVRRLKFYVFLSGSICQCSTLYDSHACFAEVTADVLLRPQFLAPWLLFFGQMCTISIKLTPMTYLFGDGKAMYFDPQNLVMCIQSVWFFPSFLDRRQPLGVLERYLQNCEIAEFAEVENGIGHETHRGWQGHGCF